MNEELLEKVLDQILTDVCDEDYTCIFELLRSVPQAALEGYLPQ